MTALELMAGRKIIVETEVGAYVELTIKEVKREHHSEDLEPSTQANDWWPASREWDTYVVYFTNGHHKIYDNLESINVI